MGVEKDEGNRFHSTEQLQFSLGWKSTEKSKAAVLFLWHWHLCLKALHLLLFSFRYFHINSSSVPTENIASVTPTHFSGFASFYLDREWKPQVPPPASAQNRPKVKGKKGLSTSSFLSKLHKYRVQLQLSPFSIKKKGLQYPTLNTDHLFLMFLSREKLLLL